MSIWARLGGTIGSGLGEGVSAGLEQVAQRRTRELARKESIKDFTNAGFTPEEAGLLLSFPEKDRFEAAQFLAARNNQYEQPRPQPTFQDLVDQERGMGQEQQQGQRDLSNLFSPQMTQKVLQQPAAQLVQSPNAANKQQEIPPQLKQVTQQLEQVVAQKQQESPGQSVRNALGRNIEKVGKSTKQQETTQKKVDSARELLQIADEMEKLHSTGKVLNGRWGTWQRKLGPLGVWEPNDETNTFDSLGSQAAILEASLIPGVTTNEKLKAAERTKPNITQTKQTQLSRIKAMRKKAQDILKQYGGSDDQSQSSPSEEQPTAGELPLAEQAQGKKFRRGNKTVKSVEVNGKWVWKAQ